MNAHSNPSFSRADEYFPSLDFTATATFPSASFPLPPYTSIEPDQLTGNGSDSVLSTCSSGCSSYGSTQSNSLPSYLTQRVSLMQRSLSSHSLQKNVSSPRPVSSLSRLLDSEGPVRRVYSTGDLQMMNTGRQQSHRSESTLSSESSLIIEGMNRSSRYSPEEKKERIERYRSKRNQRNFNKKIKDQYECRKTLADCRPRIRGRFARYEEIEDQKNCVVEWSNIDPNKEVVMEDMEDGEYNWINFLTTYSSNLFPI